MIIRRGISLACGAGQDENSASARSRLRRPFCQFESILSGSSTQSFPGLRNPYIARSVFARRWLGK